MCQSRRRIQETFEQFYGVNPTPGYHYLVLLLQVENIAVEEGCGVHLDPGDVRSRTKVRLVVKVVGVGAVTGVDQLQCSSHHQHYSQGDHLNISDNSANTKMAVDAVLSL